jgi:putative DNA primase/helicase
LDRRARLLSDLGNAARLFKHHGNDIRYCHSFARWYFWNGSHWRMDDQGRIVELCKQTALSIYDEAKRAEGEAQKAITRWALTSQGRDRLTAMAALAQPDVAVTPDDLDADGWLLNCSNGTVDLRTGQLQPHRREDRITRVLQVEFAPDAQCPQFERFLQETFRGDQDLIRHVQNWHGHCLTSDIREQFLYIYLGGGANGKSVLLDTICEVMGTYAGEAPPDLLTLRKHPEHPTEIADLCGRRLVIASETEKEAVLRLQLIKRLTGNARLKGRWMRQDYFEFPRTHKTILVTNNPPLIPEHTEAAERRLRIVPFVHTVPEDQRDPQLLLKFRAEHIGILAWLVRGCLQWQVEGLPRVPAMNAAKSRLLGEINSLECFIRARCVLGEREECEAAELHAEYDGWCRIHGRRTLNATEISAVLRRHQCEDGKSRGRRCWFGIGLVPADSGHDGRNGRGFPVEPQCAFHEGVNGKVASNASTASNHTPLDYSRACNTRREMASENQPNARTHEP